MDGRIAVNERVVGWVDGWMGGDSSQRALHVQCVALMRGLPLLCGDCQSDAGMAALLPSHRPTVMMILICFPPSPIRIKA